VLTAPRALDENLRVLNSKRPLTEDGQETLYCTSCKKDKPVDPKKPECLTCLSCRESRKRKYDADKLESAAEVEEVRRSSQQVLAADNSGFLVEHFSRHGPDDTEKVQYNALHQLAAKRPQMLLDLDVRKHFFVDDRTFAQMTALGVV